MGTIAIDFDGPIYSNRGPYQQAHFDVLKSVSGIDPRATYDMSKEGRSYNAGRHYQLLAQHGKRGVSPEDIRDAVDGFLRGCREYLFPEVVEFLRAVSGLGFSVCVVSTGDEWFQGRKIEYSGVQNLVDDVFITQDSDKIQVFSRVVDMHEGPYWLIEDSAEPLNAVKRRFPGVMAVHILRDGVVDDPARGADLVVSSLREALKLFL